MMNKPRAASAAQTQYTIGDILRELKQRLPRKRFMHLAYRVEWVCNLMGEAPSKIALDIPELRKRIAAIDVARAGMAPHSLQKLLWAFRYTLETSPYLDPEFNGRSALLAPEWKEVLAKASTPNVRGTLSRFAYYCNRRGIAPRKADRDIFCEFEKHWHETRLLQNQPVHSRKLARSWDELATGVPQLRLKPFGVAMPRRTGKYIPYEQLPGSLRHEINHFLAARESLEVLTNDAFTRPIGPITAGLTRRRIHRAVDALVRAGEPITNIKSLAMLTSPESFRRILQICNNDKGRRANYDNWYLAGLLRHIAKLWGKRSSDELEKLKKIHARIPDPRGAMGRAYADLLQQFDDPDALRDLVAAPGKIWDKIRTETNVTSHTLARAQSALGLALAMKNAPMLGPLAVCSFDKHLELDSANETGWLVLGRDETPSGNGLRSPLSPELVQPLLEYRDRIYPAIAGRPPTHVFQHRHGRLKSKAQVRSLIQQAALRYARVRVTPQMFRSLAGLLMIKRGATLDEVARALGVKDVKALASQFEDILRDRDMQEFADGVTTEGKTKQDER
jgi:hypothetical protein